MAYTATHTAETVARAAAWLDSIAPDLPCNERLAREVLAARDAATGLTTQKFDTRLVKNWARFND